MVICLSTSFYCILLQEFDFSQTQQTLSLFVSFIFAFSGLTRNTPPVCTKSKDNVTLSKINITAEAGLYAMLPCSFTTEDGFCAKRITLYKHGKTIFDSSDDQKKNNSEFQRQVSLLESDLKMKNCSIIINDLTETDAGSYQVRVSDNKTENGCTLNFTVTVTDIKSYSKYLQIPNSDSFTKL